MGIKEILYRVKRITSKQTMAVALATTIGAGAMGIGVDRGRTWKAGEDNITISQLQKENDRYRNQTIETEKWDNDFLLDLRGHLPADAELENLLKAGDIHPTPATAGFAGSIGDGASVACCVEEMRRFRQYASASDLITRQKALTSGKWLRLRCSEYLKS